ncbi:MAG: tRNA preQ1(34) S-adenosylmethionine ribosyltransferase-isomerase QueA [Candidatus Acidiferrum sp.]|jgi:S-adenosylmethionine:tRNA ribosyltransferase-isomerase
MRLEDFDYDLPAKQIAQHPPERRDGARLLLIDRQALPPYAEALTDTLFSELPRLLRGDELLVFNNARVIPARLFGRRASSTRETAPSSRQPEPSGEVEVFLSREVAENTWEALVKPGRKLEPGSRILFGDQQLAGEIISRDEFGLRTIKFRSLNHHPVTQHFEALGHVPLPPYISRRDEISDRERYQTIFAKCAGAVAAPTAGLHFTTEILQAIRDRGIETCELTLHVGLGTFQPIRTETLEAHTMHAESFEIPEETAARICAARAASRPILAVGTTVVRALEAAALRAAELRASGRRTSRLVEAGRGEATLFMYPGFAFQVVDALLTNFHLPRSTLLALVSAFAGRERVFYAYRHAVDRGYRFYSYGDCMLLR